MAKEVKLVCPKHNIEKVYRVHRSHKAGVSIHCVECTKESHALYNKNQLDTNHRRRNLKARYGITQEMYTSLLEMQQGVCAICGQPETKKDKSGRVQPLAVDHDHTTGKVRGLLCHKHNTLLGYADDNITILNEAIVYLHKHID